MQTITFKNEILNKKEGEVFIGTNGYCWKIVHKCDANTYTAYPLSFISACLFKFKNWRTRG